MTDFSEQEKARLRKILDKEGSSSLAWNENHFALVLFALSVLSILAALYVDSPIFRSYMEQIGDIGVYHIVIAGFFALFGTTRVNIVEQIINSDSGVSVFLCGYVVGLAIIIAG